MSKSKYFPLLVAGAIIGCNDTIASGDKPHALARTYLISADSVNTISAENLKSYAAYGHPSIQKLVRYSVSTYKVLYKTTYNDKPIQASGLIFVPTSLSVPAPIVSLQHGTTFLKSQAPSSTADFTGMEYFASAGYIAIMPDYIGYGASEHVFHPYYDEKHSAISVIDFIKASREFLTDKRIFFDDQLFLAGYSEGGYVTLAAAQEIETKRSHNLEVTAIAAGAGGYDLGEMLKSVTSKSSYSYPAYLAFVIMAYNQTYGWNRPLNYYFQDKYAKALETYLTGAYDGWQINSRLTTDVRSLLNTSFYERLKNSNGEPEFKRALFENSVGGWKTNIPMRLYHGTKDEIIPYQNSEATLAKFKASGSHDVTLTLIPNGTHGSAFIPMLQKFVPWFESFRKD
jgi:alpha-beta hydrolase superfamily lysophospholipase